MPRPTATDSNDASQDLQLQRLNSTTANTNTPLVLNSDITNSNSSSDYHQQFSSAPAHLVQQNSFSSTLSDENSSNMFSLSMQEPPNDTTTSSSNSIPISRSTVMELNNNSMKIITTPNVSPIHSLHSTPRPIMEDKCIQCINDEDNENSIEQDAIGSIDIEQIKKRSGDDVVSNEESWTIAADR